MSEEGRRLFLCLALLVGGVSPVWAQRSVRVVDGLGAPVSSVRIDVMGRGEVLEVVVTDGNGTALLSTERWSEVRRISLSHVGYETRVVSVEDVRDGADIPIEPTALPIDGLVVDSEALCPIEEDGQARALWRAMASRYSDETGTRALSARMTRSGSAVPGDELHRWAAPGGAHMIFGRAGGGHSEDGLGVRPGQRVETAGYAWEPQSIGGTWSPRFLNWAYLDLHMDEAAHLTTAAFGELHLFDLAGVSEGEATLVFCPNGQGPETTLRGTMLVSADTTLLRADWRFGTPDHDEGAGGWAEFDSWVSPYDAATHLVPTRGVYFRHDGMEPQYPHLPRTYLRESVTYEAWFVHEGPDHPCHTDRQGGYNFFGENAESGFEGVFVGCVAGYIPPVREDGL